MKNTVYLLIILASAAAFPALEASQESPPPPQLYLMGDFLVDVSRVAEYERALKELIAHLGRHGFSLVFDTYATDDSHFYVIYGLKSLGDLDRWDKAWKDLAASMGLENLGAIQRRLAAAELERVYKLWYFRPDISFLPEKERLKPDQIGHYTWDFIWVMPGREAEFEALNREWVALSKARGVRDPFMTYAGGLGTSMPVYVWFEYGKSAADYAAAEERFWKALGAQGADLSKRTRALIRRMESKTGRYRPDLSFAPHR